VQGGPQANNGSLLIAGKIDFYMGGNTLRRLRRVEQGMPVVDVAAIFQKDPQVFMSHPGSGLDKWADLAKATTSSARRGYDDLFQWMKSAYGFKRREVKPYTFNPAPFIADKQSRSSRAI
jgi:NitT/TauT family transport system substrate-binding protein